MSAQVRRLDERFASAFVAGNDARLGEKALIRSSSRLANRIERREPSFRASTPTANALQRAGALEGGDEHVDAKDAYHAFHKRPSLYSQ
jgi:hypothetical protein